ncbi:MAG: translation initiation factor IF-2 associated domain-containing protein, partial [Methylocystis sp.]|nr:translation initiation factor IF-2 associated domain-containing protein [Methylocystis sp.]
MSEGENSGDKTLTVAPSKTLHLKQRPVEHGMVRQSFSHGRSKVVVVEKVKRRAPGHVEPAKPAGATAPIAEPPAPPPKAAPRSETQRSAPAPRSGSGVVLRALTDEEREARARALVDAKSREEDDRRRAEIDAKARNEREEREHAERAAADSRKREEEERLAREAESKRKSEEEARRRLPGDAAGVAAPRTPVAAAAPSSAGARAPIRTEGETAVRRPPVRTIGGFTPPAPPRP